MIYIYISSILTEYEWFLNRSIWPINGTFTETTNPGQSVPGSNGNEGASHIPQITIAQSSRDVEYADCISTEGGVEYFFITITPMSTLTQGPIYGPKRTINLFTLFETI